MPVVIATSACELRAVAVRARGVRLQGTEIMREIAARTVLVTPRMSLNAALLRSSFDLVVDRRPDLTVRFYEILFMKYPELAPMFKGNAQTQAKMLAGAISAVLDHLEDALWLQSALGELGARHAGYGVTDAMYGQVGDALIATRAEVAGADWTAEMARQWGMAYGAITDMMKAGSQVSMSRSSAA